MHCSLVSYCCSILCARQCKRHVDIFACSRKVDMFWRVPSYSQASPLEGILDKQEFTLEELLDEEDLIQVLPIQNLSILTWVLGMSNACYKLSDASENLSDQD